MSTRVIDRTLSTRWTYFIRFIGLLFWAVIALILYQIVVPPSGMSRMMTIIVSIPLSVVIFGLGWLLATLKMIRATDKGLVVRGLVKQTTVPYSEIKAVTSFQGFAMFVVSVPFVTVKLKNATTMGSKFRFLTRVTLLGWSKGVHPDVIFLKHSVATGEASGTVSDFKHSDETGGKCAKRTQRVALLIAGGFIVSIGLVLGMYFFIAYIREGIVPGPTFIEDIRKGAITSSNISEIHFLEFVESKALWDSGLRKKEDYSRFQSKKLTSREIIDELVSVLLEDTTDGYENRNHPSPMYEGILRVELKNSGFYYLYYQLIHDWEKEEYYVRLHVNSKFSTNKLGTKVYGNVPFAAFLKKYDPWYREWWGN